jgi:hypothetical protein
MTTDRTESISALRSAVADIEQVILMLERLALSAGITVALAQSVSGIENHYARSSSPPVPGRRKSGRRTVGADKEAA